MWGGTCARRREGGGGVGNGGATEAAIAELADRERAITTEDIVDLQHVIEPRLARGLRREQNWVGGPGWSPLRAAVVHPPEGEGERLGGDLARFAPDNAGKPVGRGARWSGWSPTSLASPPTPPATRWCGRRSSTRSSRRSTRSSTGTAAPGARRSTRCCAGRTRSGTRSSRSAPCSPGTPILTSPGSPTTGPTRPGWTSGWPASRRPPSARLATPPPSPPTPRRRGRPAPVGRVGGRLRAGRRARGWQRRPARGGHRGVGRTGARRAGGATSRPRREPRPAPPGSGGGAPHPRHPGLRSGAHRRVRQHSPGRVASRRAPRPDRAGGGRHPEPGEGAWSAGALDRCPASGSGRPDRAQQPRRRRGYPEPQARSRASAARPHPLRARRCLPHVVPRRAGAVARRRRSEAAAVPLDAGRLAARGAGFGGGGGGEVVVPLSPAGEGLGGDALGLGARFDLRGGLGDRKGLQLSELPPQRLGLPLGVLCLAARAAGAVRVAEQPRAQQAPLPLLPVHGATLLLPGMRVPPRGVGRPRVDLGLLLGRRLRPHRHLLRRARDRAPPLPGQVLALVALTLGLGQRPAGAPTPERPGPAPGGDRRLVALPGSEDRSGVRAGLLDQRRDHLSARLLDPLGGGLDLGPPRLGLGTVCGRLARSPRPPPPIVPPGARPARCPVAVGRARCSRRAPARPRRCPRRRPAPARWPRAVRGRRGPARARRGTAPVRLRGPRRRYAAVSPPARG